MTITVTGDYVLGKYERVDAHERAAFTLGDNTYVGTPTLTNRGAISNASTNDVYYVDGVYVAYAPYGGGSYVHNDTGATISVAATGDYANAKGIETGSTLDIVNAGRIDVTSDGYAYGVTAFGKFSFDNSGSLNVTGALQTMGVQMSNGGVFSNEGDIDVTGTGSTGVIGVAYGYSYPYSSVPSSFSNSGSIQLADQTATLDSIAVLGAAGTSLVYSNSGTISADIVFQASPTYGSATGDTWNNSGRLIGAMLFLNGPDTVHNTGTIQGAVHLGGGADVLDSTTGSLLGTVFGDAGDDTLTGSAGADTLYGDTGDPLQEGGADHLYGLGGDDRLFGDRGNDFLDGGDGNDRLEGGPGQDFLTGGAGADTFAFSTTCRFDHRPGRQRRHHRLPARERRHRSRRQRGCHGEPGA